MHKLRKYTCTYEKCQRSFCQLVDLEKHIEDHQSSSNFTCNIEDCAKVYKNRYTLMQHKIKQHKISKYDCEDCGEKCSSLIELRTHRLIHMDKSSWPYACDVEGCDQRFRRSNLMEIHKKCHGIKSHICPYCAFRTYTSSEMNRHINIHTFERKYPCAHCSRVFKTSIYRANHTRRVHMNQVFPCSSCDRTFKTQYSRRHHEMSHKGIIPYPCDECDKKFKWPNGLKRHKQNVHMGDHSYDSEIKDEQQDEDTEMELELEENETSCPDEHVLDNTGVFEQNGQFFTFIEVANQNISAV